MSAPWSAAMATAVLARMSDARLAAVTERDFRTWPAPRPLPAAIGRQLIDNERATRRGGRAA